MQTLESIKKRIKSVKTTSKITGAMKLIATANIHKQSKEFQMIASYCHDFYEIIKPLANASNLVYKKELEANNDKGTLYVLVSSSLGLCGAFNINVAKFVIERLKPNDKVIVIGKKGYSYLKSHGYENKILYCIEVSDKNLNYLEILPLSGIVMELFQTKQFSHVKLVYTKFLNSMTFNPVEINVLPFDNELFKDDQSKDKFITALDLVNEKKQEIEYESSKRSILDAVMPSYVATLIFASIIESRLCESGSRRNAMDTATKNAKELIDSLLLQYNRARQEKITQEINEIVAGGTNE